MSTENGKDATPGTAPLFSLEITAFSIYLQNCGKPDDDGKDDPPTPPPAAAPMMIFDTPRDTPHDFLKDVEVPSFGWQGKKDDDDRPPAASAASMMMRM